jgi:glycosyltransferase involved in cell wall biosynthesis
MAKIDVIVPCYNYGRFLTACVESILRQSFQDLRVLIIDDASLDDSAAVARQLAAADPRVDAILHERNRGHIETYNEGIERATADYLMILSADDLLAPGALERARDIFDRWQEIVLVHGGCIEWDDGLALPEPREAQDRVWTRYEGDEFAWEFCYSGFNVVHTPTVIVRTSVQKGVGGYCAHLPHSGDMEMFLRFAPQGAVAHVHATQAFKRCHRHNMSNDYLEVKWRDCLQRKLAFDRFFEEHAPRLPGADRMRARAETAMAESAFWIGIAQVCQGQFASGRSLLRFAIELRPALRYRPPMSRLLREPDLPARLTAVLGGGLGRIAQRARAALSRS